MPFSPQQILANIASALEYYNPNTGGTFKAFVDSNLKIFRIDKYYLIGCELRDEIRKELLEWSKHPPKLVFNKKLKYPLKVYKSTDILHYGMHKGMTIEEVLVEDSRYFIYEITRNNHFILDPELFNRNLWWSTIDNAYYINEVKYECYLEFKDFLSEFRKLIFVRAKKKELYENRMRRKLEDESEDFSSIQYQRDKDTFQALTDGMYGDFDDFNGDFDSLRDQIGF